MKSILLCTALLFVVSCGSDRGSITTPLTADQKTIFSNTLDAYGNIEKSGQGAYKTRSAVSEESTEAKSTKDLMAASLEAGQCTVDVKSSSKGGNQNSEVGMSITGESCPVVMNLSVKTESDIDAFGKSGTLSVEFNMDYTVKDDEYKKLNDIIAAKMSGSGTISATQDSIDGTVSVDGNLTSQEHGDLEFYYEFSISGNQKANEIVSVVGVKYTDFTGELKLVVTKTESGTEKAHFLNGKEINAEEFETFMNKVGSLGDLVD